MKATRYKKFFLMLSISFVVMYSVMFLNVVSLGHIYFSLTRLYMTFLMISPMAIIMLLLMKQMYKNKKMNIAIIIGSIAVFVLSLIFLRNQTFIGDVQYMKAMIPHHSSAILTSENASINNPDVDQLAKDIIETQKKEIELMKEYIEKIK